MYQTAIEGAIVVPPPLVPEGRRLELTERLIAWTIGQARHGPMCRASDDPHCPHSMADDRVTCAQYPCSCGLAPILQELMPSIRFEPEEEEEEEEEDDLTPADFEG